MKPETAMRQAGLTAIEYTAQSLEWIEKLNLELTDEAKLQCASRMALAASIDYATAVCSGNVQGYPGIEVVVKNLEELKQT